MHINGYSTREVAHSLLLIFFGVSMISRAAGWQPLAEPDYSKKEQFHEVLVHYMHGIPEVYNGLTPGERIMVYYLYRACIPAGPIYADQMHRFSISLIAIFESINAQAPAIRNELGDDFIKQAQTYLVYLLSNNGPYFKREHPHKKRTPSLLGLAELTKANLIKALQIAKPNSTEALKTVWSFLDDHTYDTIATVSGNIDASGVNIYSADFIA